MIPPLITMIYSASEKWCDSSLDKVECSGIVVVYTNLNFPSYTLFPEGVL